MGVRDACAFVFLAESTEAAPCVVGASLLQLLGCLNLPFGPLFTPFSLLGGLLRRRRKSRTFVGRCFGGSLGVGLRGLVRCYLIGRLRKRGFDWWRRGRGTGGLAVVVLAFTAISLVPSRDADNLRRNLKCLAHVSRVRDWCRQCEQGSRETSSGVVATVKTRR